MSDDSSFGSLGDEEVAFWRGFIQWWARETDGPVPSRAWEALACAEDKRTQLSAECNEEGNA